MVSPSIFTTKMMMNSKVWMTSTRWRMNSKVWMTSYSMADDNKIRNCDGEDIICRELLTRDPAYPSAAIPTGEAFAVNPRFVKEKLLSEFFLRHDIVSTLRVVTLFCARAHT